MAGDSSRAGRETSADGSQPRRRDIILGAAAATASLSVSLPASAETKPLRQGANGRPNIVFIDQSPSDQIMAAVVVTTDALGNITSIRLKKSSGFAPWDDAVLRALNKTRVMPRDINGSVPSPMLLKFRPSDMGSAP